MEDIFRVHGHTIEDDWSGVHLNCAFFLLHQRQTNSNHPDTLRPGDFKHTIDRDNLLRV